MTEKEKGKLCKGSYLLGTACGKCERCKDFLKNEYSQLFQSNPINHRHHIDIEDEGTEVN